MGPHTTHRDLLSRIHEQKCVYGFMVIHLCMGPDEYAVLPIVFDSHPSTPGLAVPAKHLDVSGSRHRPGLRYWSQCYSYKQKADLDSEVARVLRSSVETHSCIAGIIQTSSMDLT